MTNIRRIVLDVLKPNEPSIVELSAILGSVPGVQAVDIKVKEVDRRVEKIQLTLVGERLDFARIKSLVERSGGSIHSVDRVSGGKKLLD